MKNNKIKKFLTVLIAVIVFCMSSNAVFAVRMKKIEPQVLNELQTYFFDTNDVEAVEKSVISTLYDSDFVIEGYEKDIGFIFARKTFKAHYVNKKRVLGWSMVLAAAGAYTAFSYGANAYYMYSPSRRVMAEMKDKTIVVDANVFIDKVADNRVRVRFLPVEKILQNADGFSFVTAAPVRVIRIYRPDVYNEFFAQVNKNLRFE